MDWSNRRKWNTSSEDCFKGDLLLLVILFAALIPARVRITSLCDSTLSLFHAVMYNAWSGLSSKRWQVLPLGERGGGESRPDGNRINIIALMPASPPPRAAPPNGRGSTPSHNAGAAHCVWRNRTEASDHHSGGDGETEKWGQVQRKDDTKKKVERRESRRTIILKERMWIKRLDEHKKRLNEWI